MYQTRTSLNDPSVLAREAETYVAQGFSAVKIKVGFGRKRDVANVRAVRQAIGDDIDLMVDANHAYDAERAIALGRRIEPYRIGWFEEPVVPEIPEAYRQVRQALSIPVAGGEAEFMRYGFQQLFRLGCLDIAQPDICITGGISETMRIAQLAQVWGIRCVPHVWGSGIALAAALQVLAAMPPEPASLNPRQPLLEFDRTENPIRERTLATPLEMVDGQVLVPSRRDRRSGCPRAVPSQLALLAVREQHLAPTQIVSAPASQNGKTRPVADTMHSTQSPRVHPKRRSAG